MKRKRMFWKILLISSLFTFISVLDSTAYALEGLRQKYGDYCAQEILWIEYDDFESISKSENLWQIGTHNMDPDPFPKFKLNGDKMIQKAKAKWYDPEYYNWPAQRARSWAMPLALPYITGVGARVTLDDYTNYKEGSSPSNAVMGRLGMIFYNDGVLVNSGGDDRTSEVFAAIEIRPTMVQWYVVRLTDLNGIGVAFLDGGLLFTADPQADLSLIPFELKLWFDGTNVYFSAETEGPAGKIIEERTYTPAGQILPPKSTPLGILESIVNINYSLPVNANDQSSIMNEWDDVWVAVEATNLGAVKHIIQKAKKASKGK